MHAIEIDFDVEKALWAKRVRAEETFNDVLRGILGLEPAKQEGSIANGQQHGEGWRVKGVLFPNGTEFRAKYRNETHPAKVEGGALVLKGKRFDSPSSAAVSITGMNVNGWNFWQARFPGQSEWRVIASLRP